MWSKVQGRARKGRILDWARSIAYSAIGQAGEGEKRDRFSGLGTGPNGSYSDPILITVISVYIIFKIKYVYSKPYI